jgi:hypothetical protein
MPKRMRDAQSAKVKLKTDDILSTKRMSCCKNSCVHKLGRHDIQEARKKYF